MKKIFLFAAAAMVSLSSCVQTNEVYTGGVQEIGFKSAVTRAVIEGTTFDGDIAVSSVWNNPADAADFVSYFDNTTFALNSEGVWAATPAKYWPSSGDMQFLALHPAISATAAYNADGTFKTLTTGLIENATAQDDVLFSDLLEVEAPQTSAQSLLFHHALAQLNINIKKVETSAVVKVNSIAVNGVGLEGVLTVTAASTSTAAWSSVATGDHLFVDTETELTTTDTNPTALLVMPSAQTEIVIEYTIDGKAQTYTHTLTGTWDMGYKYTYNYTINVNEILFDCTVDEWEDFVPSSSTTI